MSNAGNHRIRGDVADLFDPKVVRILALLPDEDQDAAHCVRHDRRMDSLGGPLLHHEGAIYTTGDGVTAYICRSCIEETEVRLPRWIPNRRVAVLETYFAEAFNSWDRGDTDPCLFKYVGEGSVEELEGGERVMHVGSQDTDE